MKKFIPFFFIFILLFFSLLYGDKKQEISHQFEKHKVTVRLVLVDVIAIDEDGNTVADLTKEDFEIYEDRKKVPVNSLDFINLQILGEKLPEKVREEKLVRPSIEKFRKRRFFVIFDSINTIKRMLDRSKPRIIEKLISLVKLGREIMVIEMGEKGDIQILQPLTSNEDLIAQAINKASGSIWVEKSADILSIPNIVRIDEIKSGMPSKYRKSVREIYQSETRHRFEKSLTSLLSIMNVIKDYPGRKSVLLVSSGFPSISFERIYSGKTPFEDNIAIISQAAAAKIKDPFKVLQKDKYRGGDEIFEDLIHFANSYNITFYTLDPDSYLRYVLPDISYDNYPRQISKPDDLRFVEDEFADIKKIELSNLKILAEDTGGISLQGMKKYDNFQKYVNRDLTSYYELSYYPRRKKADGKYHKIRVKVKRPGVKIRFRKGYYDYKLSQIESLLFASTSANPGLFQQISFQARAIPFVRTRDKFILWMNMALPVQKLILGSDPSKESKILKVNIWVDDQKGQEGFNAQLNIPLALTSALRQKLRNAEYLGYSTCSNEIKLKQDKYNVIFTLYDEESGRVGTVVQTLEVPILKEESEAKIVNAIFGRMMSSKEDGRSFTISQKDGALQVANQKFYLKGSNQFRSGENVSLFLQVYIPQRNVEFEPQFFIHNDKIGKEQIPAEKVTESWNKKAKILNIVFNLNFMNIIKGKYSLRIGLVDPSNERKIEKELMLKII